MNEKILHALSHRELKFNKLKKEVDEERIRPTLQEMEENGLIFSNKNESYALTLLGKIVALGKQEAYKKITTRTDLFEFFRTRIPSVMPDELLKKFMIADDFSLIGKPDFANRFSDIIAKGLEIQTYAEKREIGVSAPLLSRPGLMHSITALKQRLKSRVLLSKEGYEKSNIFLKIATKLADVEIKVIEDPHHYMGLQYVDDKFSLFGFRTTNNTPGWDAVIVTKNEKCIEWVRENFEYMWNNLAEEP